MAWALGGSRNLGIASDANRTIMGRIRIPTVRRPVRHHSGQLADVAGRGPILWEPSSGYLVSILDYRIVVRV